MSKFRYTGIKIKEDDFREIKRAFTLEMTTPIMAVLPHGKCIEPPDWRGMANDFAVVYGLPEGKYAIDPETLEFAEIVND